MHTEPRSRSGCQRGPGGKHPGLELPQQGAERVKAGVTATVSRGSEPGPRGGAAGAGRYSPSAAEAAVGPVPVPVVVAVEVRHCCCCARGGGPSRHMQTVWAARASP